VAARRQAAFFERAERGLVVVTGRDRASYLQGLLTNDVATLAAGQGRYAAYLTAQGRMIADLYVYELGDLMLAVVPLAQKDVVLTKFDQLIFSEDVQLGDVTSTFSAAAIVGPRAADVVRGVVGAAVDSLGADGCARVQFHGAPAIITRVADTGEPGFDVYIERGQMSRLLEGLDAAGVPRLDTPVAEALRIEAGVPLFGRDMDETTIPLEAGIEQRAISFSKGCYVGQEVIIRVLHRGRGRVARRLVGLTLDGTDAALERTPVSANAEEVGVVTSSSWSPALGKAIALAYVHRDFTAPGTEVSVGGVRAVVAALPFVQMS
jgi:folate-binding protein YgfZ